MNKRSREEILNIYQSRVDDFQEQLIAHKRLSTRYSYLRLAIFVLAIPFIYFLTKAGIIAVIVGIIISIFLFIQAVLRQQKFDKLVLRCEHLIEINQNEIDNILSFQNIYYNGEQFAKSHHLYTDDLDIFGENSLFNVINRTKTYDGVLHLAKLFLNKPTSKELLIRQEAVQELEAKLDWRQDFANTLYDIEGGHNRNLAQEIDEELQLDLGFASHRWLNLYRRALPFIWLGVIILYFFNIDTANSIATFIIILNLFLTLRKSNATTNVQNHLSRASIMLRSYKDSLGVIFNEHWSSELLKDKVNFYKSKTTENNSVQILSDLRSIIEHLDYRLNLIPAFILNGLVLWDFRVLNRLSEWREQHKGKLKELFEFVGMMEALSSLSIYAYNHPTYAYPTITEEYFKLDAVQIEHPLIPLEENVSNDFSIGKTDHLSIITGSNMSGKSTLLRTIGINMILGYTGTKVAAKSFSYPIVTLISYMRIKDILEESVSTFKAELNRIQLILSLLETHANCFILIDEMLRGTNSKDKLTGSIGIAKRLLAEETYAMIATHDIKLAEMGKEVEEGIANYYFDIDYADGDLVFDYKVKEGICQNFNASFLLQQLGIEMTDE